MANIYNNLHQFDHSDPNHLRVVRIESDKQKSNEGKETHLTIDRSQLFYQVVITLLRTEIDQLLHPEVGSRIQTKVEFIQFLNHFSELLKKLKERDESQNLAFSTELSSAWMEIVFYYERLRHHRSPPDYLDKITLIIKMIQEYPEDSQHSLGYYLTEHTGEKWIPFPYMELLHKLHNDAILYKQRSTLQMWIHQITKLLTYLGSPSDSKN